MKVKAFIERCLEYPALSKYSETDKKETESDKSNCDKYPFGVYDKVFIKVPDLNVDNLLNWTRAQAPKLCLMHREIPAEQKCSEETEMWVAPKPVVSTEGLVGRRNDKGYLISLNEELIALFKVEGKVYAMRDSCPHAGGPLSVGDIEELPFPECGLAVQCPWHNWKIHLETGKVVSPQGHKESALVYPVNVTSKGDIYVGVDALSDKFFNLSLHPSVDVVPRKSSESDLSSSPTPS